MLFENEPKEKIKRLRAKEDARKSKEVVSPKLCSRGPDLPQLKEERPS